jgi:hypothetical protein
MISAFEDEIAWVALKHDTAFMIQDPEIEEEANA